MSADHRSTTTVSTKGQVIVPKPIRERRRWGLGTRLVVEDTPEGVVLREEETGESAAGQGPEEGPGERPRERPGRRAETRPAGAERADPERPCGLIAWLDANPVPACARRSDADMESAILGGHEG